MKPGRIFYLVFVSLLIQCKNRDNNKFIDFKGKPPVPSTILQKHDYLISTISKWTTSGDSTARAAIKLKEIMDHHFQEEENYVLPALGALPAIASGKIPIESGDLLRMIEQYKANANHFLAEHQFIKAYMKELMSIAEKENHPGIIEFEKTLAKHAKEEEEVLFPTVVLIGEYLKMVDK